MLLRHYTFFILHFTLAICAVCARSAQTAHIAQIAPTELRCEHRDNPLGIRETQPRLTWRLEATDPSLRNLAQTAWQIQVASTPEKLAAGEADIWDSGRVESTDVRAIYAGPKLAPNQQVWWRLRVWDNSPAPAASPWSAPATWSRGLLNTWMRQQTEEWPGTWIGLDDTPVAQTAKSAKGRANPPGEPSRETAQPEASPYPLTTTPQSALRNPQSDSRRAFLATAATGSLAVAGVAAMHATRGLAQDQNSTGEHTGNDHADTQGKGLGKGQGQGKGKGKGKGKGGQGQGHGKAGKHIHDRSKFDNPSVVAPPGARSTARVLAQCTACQLCVSACPSHVIEPAVLHYGSLTGLMKPRLNFDKSFCEFNCTVCSDVCPNGTLLPLGNDDAHTPPNASATHAERHAERRKARLDAKHTTRIGLASVDHSRCIIVKDSTDCGACAEHCPTAALQIKKLPGHPLPVPVVDASYCIGCGACQYPCPETPKAIIVSGLAVHETAEVLVEEKVKATTTDDFAF